MKKLLIAIILFLAAVPSVLAADMNPSTRLRLFHQPSCLSRADNPPPYQPLMLMIGDEDVVETLLDMGVIIYNRRDNLLLTSIPRDKLLEVLALPGILNADSSGDMSSNMDKARPFGFVDQVQDEVTLDGMPFDGTGVVVGFSDIGFDNKHIAFKDRVVALYDYDASYGRVRQAVTPKEISLWHTDHSDEWHATHVANILGGAYKGAPYYGVATGAEMVATTSDLSDVGILAGVEDIIAYAKKVQKPAVINLSLGNFLGAHDGTSLFCQYLSRCAEDAIICLSAGNTGGTMGYAYKDLINDTDITRVLVNSLITYNGFEVAGLSELWSATDAPFDFRIEVYDIDTREPVYFTPWLSGSDGSSLIINDDDQLWSQYMSGIVAVETGVSSLNGRYCVSVAYDTKTEETAANSDGRWSRYYTSLAIKGATGAERVHVDIFADATYSNLGIATTPVSPVFSHDGSISDLCTASGVVAVGACNSRNKAPSLMDREMSWPFVVDHVAAFSSYSTMYTMPRLPHISAPGNYVVSAMSTPYLENHDDAKKVLCAVSYVDGEYYYWAAQCGTSMSSPYAAGVIAVWLQANPALTAAEVIEIAQSTALTDYPDISDPRWGAGCIDALAGLRLIEASVDSPIADADTDERIYTLTGYPLSMERYRQHDLPAGIYIITSGNAPARKIVIH